MRNLSIILLLKPILRQGTRIRLCGGGIGALDFNGHGFVLLEAACQIGLLGGGRGFGSGKGLDVALGVGVLDGGGLVGLELLEVEFLDEVGCGRIVRLASDSGLEGAFGGDGEDDFGPRWFDREKG